MVTISVDHARAVRAVSLGWQQMHVEKVALNLSHPPCRRKVKHGPVSATTFPTVCTVDVHGRGLRRRAAPRRARTSRKVEQKDIFSQHNRNENSERTNMVVCLIHIPRSHLQAEKANAEKTFSVNTAMIAAHNQRAVQGLET